MVTLRNIVDTLKGSSEKKYTINDKCKNLVTAHIEATVASKLKI